jgi:hypothetical protein
MISPRREWIDKQSLMGIRLDETVGVRIYLDQISEFSWRVLLWKWAYI